MVNGLLPRGLNNCQQPTIGVWGLGFRVNVNEQEMEDEIEAGFT